MKSEDLLTPETLAVRRGFFFYKTKTAQRRFLFSLFGQLEEFQYVLRC